MTRGLLGLALSALLVSSCADLRPGEEELRPAAELSASDKIHYATTLRLRQEAGRPSPPVPARKPLRKAASAANQAEARRTLEAAAVPGAEEPSPAATAGQVGDGADSGQGAAAGEMQEDRLQEGAPAPEAAASAQPPLDPVAPSAPPAIPAASPEWHPIKPEALVGLDAASTVSLLGEPALLIEEPPAKIWAYNGSDCVLQIFFYPKVGGSDFRVLTYKVLSGERSSGANAEGMADRCFGGIIAVANATQTPPGGGAGKQAGTGERGEEGDAIKAE